MARITVDVPLLLITALSDRLPGVDLRPDYDEKTPTAKRMVIVTPVQGAMISNGHWQLGWRWQIAFTLVADSLSSAEDLGDELYQAVHELEGTQVENVGGISAVTDQIMPVRTAVSVSPTKKTLVQYNAQFEMVVRPIIT